MFMTLRYGREDGNGIQCLEQTNQPLRLGDNVFNSACTTCRRKKLRCSREKTGCRRCLSRGFKCVYATGKMEGKKPRSHAEPNVAPQPAGPLLSSGINDIESLAPTPEQETAIARPSLNSQPFRTPSTAVPVEGGLIEGHNKNTQPKKRLICSASQSMGPVGNPNGESEVSGPDTPEMACGASISALATSSEQFPSTLSNDYFSQLFEPFEVNHDIIGTRQILSNELNVDYLSPDSSGLSSIETSLNMESFIPSNLSQGLFASPSGLLDSNFGTTTSRSPMDMDNSENCECTGNALLLLEMVAVQLKGADWNTTERKLYLLKRNISRCFALAQCGSCTQDSGFAILVLVLYEKITTTFEEVVHWWKRHLDTPARTAINDGHNHLKSREGYPQKDEWQQISMSLGRYQIDTVEEHCKVFATLISLQLHRLITLVSVMKRNIRSSNWEAHLALLKMLSSRIKLLQATLQY